MKQLYRIDCPAEIHKKKKYTKILAFYRQDVEPGKINKLWIHCDHNCKHWIQLEFNKDGGVTAQIMPKDVKFYDYDKVPLLLIGNEK